MFTLIVHHDYGYGVVTKSDETEATELFDAAIERPDTSAAFLYGPFTSKTKLRKRTAAQGLRFLRRTELQS